MSPLVGVSGVTICKLVDSIEDLHVNDSRVTICTPADMSTLKIFALIPNETVFIHAAMICFPDTIRCLTHVYVARSFSVSLFSVWAISADTLIFSGIYRYDRVDILSQYPNLHHIAGFDICGFRS